MKQLKDMYREIEGMVEPQATFFRADVRICPEVGDILTSPAMTATVTKVKYLVERHAIRIDIDNGEHIGLNQLLKLIDDEVITIK